MHLFNQLIISQQRNAKEIANGMIEQHLQVAMTMVPKERRSSISEPADRRGFCFIQNSF